MPTPCFTSEELHQLHELARQWAKIVSRRAFGDDGPGLDVDFRTFEQVATAAAQGLTEGTLQLLLEQQADKLPDEQPRPHCGKLCPTKPHTRPLTAQGPRSSRSSGSPTAPTAGGTFSPLRTVLGLDEHAFSSSVLELIVTATARFSSFRDATDAVRMAGIAVSESQLRRLAHEVGAELIETRDRKAVEHRRRQLPPRTAVVPEAVVVEVDGGRIRTRAAGSAAGVHEAQNKEDEIACPATPGGPTFATDPCPEPPEAFLSPRRVQRLVARMKGPAGGADPQEIPGERADLETTSAAAEPTGRWSPARLVRTCVASLEASSSFGPLVAAEARRRHFYQAARRAFVADGAAYNRSIRAGYFPDFEPVVDLPHVLCYVYSSARAVSADEASGWPQYRVWMRACWQGRVGEVLVESDRWQDRPGLPPPGEAGSVEDRRDPRRLVAEARSYLRDNRERMDYPRYRRGGLPTTSSLVESLVGEFNARVKTALERMLDTELDAHLQRRGPTELTNAPATSRATTDAPEPAPTAPKNRRNGHSKKTVGSDMGEFTLKTPTSTRSPHSGTFSGSV